MTKTGVALGVGLVLVAGSAIARADQLDCRLAYFKQGTSDKVQAMEKTIPVTSYDGNSLEVEMKDALSSVTIYFRPTFIDLGPICQSGGKDECLDGSYVIQYAYLPTQEESEALTMHSRMGLEAAEFAIPLQAVSGVIVDHAIVGCDWTP